MDGLQLLDELGDFRLANGAFLIGLKGPFLPLSEPPPIASARKPLSRA
jgi:hypothetical protein